MRRQTKPASPRWRRPIVSICPSSSARTCAAGCECQVPHFEQQIFASLDEYLKRAGRGEASLEDVERVYTREMLGARGQMDLEHYETRLRMVLGVEGYRVALEILTEAAVHGGLLSNGCSSHTDSSRGTLPRKRHHVVRDPDVLTISIGQQGPRLVDALNFASGHGASRRPVHQHGAIAFRSASVVE